MKSFSRKHFLLFLVLIGIGSSNAVLSKEKDDKSKGFLLWSTRMFVEKVIAKKLDEKYGSRFEYKKNSFVLLNNQIIVAGLSAGLLSAARRLGANPVQTAPLREGQNRETRSQNQRQCHYKNKDSALRGFAKWFVLGAAQQIVIENVSNTSWCHCLKKFAGPMINGGEDIVSFVVATGARIATESAWLTAEESYTKQKLKLAFAMPLLSISSDDVWNDGFFINFFNNVTGGRRDNWTN